MGSYASMVQHLPSRKKGSSAFFNPTRTVGLRLAISFPWGQELMVFKQCAITDLLQSRIGRRETISKRLTDWIEEAKHELFKEISLWLQGASPKEFWLPPSGNSLPPIRLSMPVSSIEKYPRWPPY